MTNSKTWFKLFASCVVVEGKSASLIYDLERFSLYNLPNEFLPLMKSSCSAPIHQIQSNHDTEMVDGIAGFFHQFVEQELGFYTETPEEFPPIDFTWTSPLPITNAVIECETLSQPDITKIASQLSDLGCKALQIRLLKSDTDLTNLVGAFRGTRIHFIELLLPDEGSIDQDSLFTWINMEPRLQRIILYGASKDDIIFEKSGSHKKIIYSRKDIREDRSEIIHKDRFYTNMQLFCEAQDFNTGLNRKVCIDKKGHIKNYLDHDAVFGNIHSDPLKKVISDPEFQIKWNLSNDKIEGCKLCQYRYACVSNSDIIKKEDKYYKLAPCPFNPETNTWS